MKWGESMLKKWLKEEPLLTKLAGVAKYVVLPGAMLAAVIYSPPDYSSSRNEKYAK